MTQLADNTGLSRSIAQALLVDPFYIAITADARSDIQREEILIKYLSYSIDEGKRLGRCECSEDGISGAAIWSIPMDSDSRNRAHIEKERYFKSILSPLGFRNYLSIIEFMEPRASELTAQSYWYLSIIGVSPSVQSNGLGTILLKPTLCEADKAGAFSYLETFTPRNVKFYERLGFAVKNVHLEPVTDSEYIIMVRPPI